MMVIIIMMVAMYMVWFYDAANLFMEEQTNGQGDGICRIGRFP